MMTDKIKNRIKRLLPFLLVLLCVLGTVSLVSCTKRERDTRDSIVCTTFVLADWTREVLGEDADSFKIELLGANGADIHSYQPTVADISQLSRGEVFIHIGGESDSWVGDVLASASNNTLCELDLSKAMAGELCQSQAKHSHGEHKGEEHEHEFDEHIWFSFSCAKSAVDKIAEILGERYPEKKELYVQNAKEYKEKICELEGEFASAAKEARVKDAVICDRYPFSYLFDFMEIEAHAAFSGCSAESEASFEVMARLVEAVDRLSLSYVIKCEGSSSDIAEAVVNNAKTKDIEILTLNSLQSLGKKDFEQGESYLSLMRENLSVIKIAIK